VKHIHHMPFGAEPSAQGTRFRLWAPGAETVAVVIEDGGGERIVPACDTGEGWYELHAAGVGAGTAYRYLIDGTQRVPDPAARAQRDDVHGPSLVVDPAAFQWRDGDWCGRPWESAVLYELHVGTFTRAGTFAGVQAQLDGLADLGITAIELMPVADFPGRRNWGYDGVLAYAPDRCYGTVDDLKALVQAAHARGLMMFLDVVYNHFGPEGNYLHAYAAEFFDPSRHTPWGAAIDFTRRQVREFFIHNALYWLEEFRFDGLRLDAVHAIDDPGAPHILEELAAAVAAGPGRERHVHLVLENDANEARFLQRDGAGCPRHYVAQWNDDLHHALHVLVSGERHGYYAEYAGAPARHLGRCLAEGFAWQGEPSPWRGGAARGQSTRGLPPTAFVGFLQNHDQIGNRAFGERITRIAPDASVQFAMTASDPADTLEYRFNPGDGSGYGIWQNGSSFSASYAAPGRYPATLQVRDSSGNLASRSARLLVIEPPSGTPPTQSSSIIVASDGRVWTVNPDADSVSVLDAATGAKLAEYPVGADPRSLAEDANGLIWVACHDADAIHVLSAYYQLRARRPELTVRQAVVESMVQMARPITLTTLTTVAGFLDPETTRRLKDF